MEDLTGKQLGQYQVIAPLGEGGMAAVYKAYQLGKMNRYVALKILPQQLAKQPEFVKRFDQEANVLAKLQHPRILPVFDFGESDGYTYLAMPFIEGGTLAGLLHGKPLPLPQIRHLIVQVAEALDYAHSQGLVHRDVKPSNVLVDERGNCLLSDFGITKIIEGAEKFTSTGGLIGTPDYMSPEQGRGDTLDQRSDIYSLGVILYEMATGRVPFKAETPLAVIIKHMHDPLPPPRTLNPNLPAAVEQVIFKALAKDREDRYQTAGELARAIQAAIPETTIPPDQPQIRETPIAAAPETVSQKKVKPKAGSPGWVWAVSGLVLILVVIGIAAVVMNAGGFVGTISRTTETPTPTNTKSAATKAPSLDSKIPTLRPTFTPAPTATPTKPAPTAAPTTPAPVATPFTGTWVGLDPDDGSTMTMVLVQTGEILEGTFKDSYSRSVPPPGWEGSGQGRVLSATTGQITFNLSRWDGKTLTLTIHMTLSNENNTLTTDLDPPAVLQRQ